MQVDDYKIDGKWATTKWIDNKYGTITRSYALWHAIRQRCKEGSSEQRNRPVYVGCTMSENFKDFQFFADWCHRQVGYLEVDEKGNKWQIDKDLLIKGNKVYSEDTCLFLPHRINTALAKGNSAKRKHKIGVCFCNTNKKFLATHKIQNKVVNLGLHETELDAFKAYKAAKEDYLKSLAVLFNDKLDSRAFTALNNYVVEEND